MKIYFAGSIRGGRDDVDNYLAIINHLKKYGRVLTEHVGDPKLENEKKLADEQIYTRDMSWLEEANIIIAEVSTASLGVGYEIKAAEDLGKKILCLCRQNAKPLSAMIAGNKNLIVKYYQDIENAIKIIDNSFKGVG